MAPAVQDLSFPVQGDGSFIQAPCTVGLEGSFILEQKRTRKRRRLEWVHSFPMYVFILSSGKDQRKFSLSFSRSL